MSFSDILIIQGNFVDASPGQRESQMCQHVAPFYFFGNFLRALGKHCDYLRRLAFKPVPNKLEWNKC